MTAGACVQEMQKSGKVGLVVSLDLPCFPHAVLYNQTIVGPRHAGAIEDPSSPSASLLPLYDPEVAMTRLRVHLSCKPCCSLHLMSQHLLALSSLTLNHYDSGMITAFSKIAL